MYGTLAPLHVNITAITPSKPKTKQLKMFEGVSYLKLRSVGIRHLVVMVKVKDWKTHYVFTKKLYVRTLMLGGMTKNSYSYIFLRFWRFCNISWYFFFHGWAFLQVCGVFYCHEYIKYESKKVFQSIIFKLPIAQLRN